MAAALREMRRVEEEMRKRERMEEEKRKAVQLKENEQGKDEQSSDLQIEKDEKYGLKLIPSGISFILNLINDVFNVIRFQIVRNRIRQTGGTVELEATCRPGARVRGLGQSVCVFIRRTIQQPVGGRRHRRPYEGNSKRFR